MSDNIILIGFMGVGKGQTARALARRTGMYTVDTDDLIETLIKLKVRAIFAKHGESFFRQLERQTADWLEHHVRSTIVSTGGGFFQVPNLKKLGRIIYLHAEVDRILERILAHPNAEKKIRKRPLLQDLEQARLLFAKRLPRYRELADMEIDVGQRTVEQTAETLARRLNLGPTQA